MISATGIRQEPCIDSAVALMNDETPTLQGLKAFGYNELEARFLRLVALHSGVFFRRHFMHFAEVKSGKRATSFLKKLRSNKHCQTYPLNKNATAYHLTSKAIYRCIGHPDLRHRRAHKIDYVKSKLLALDYVLENPNQLYFPTEEEKLHLFTEVLRIPITDLPAKAYKTPNSQTETVRYFVDKFPLFLSDLSPAAVVHFTYVDPGPYTSIVDFLNHLRLYGTLLSRLEEIRMVYIYYASNKWKQAQDIFHSFVRAGCKVGAKDLDLLKYFHLRQSWEAKEYERVGATELLFLNQAKKRYVGSQYEELYCEWKNGDRSRSVEASNDGQKVPVGSFSAYKIGENYSVFGDLD